VSLAPYQQYKDSGINWLGNIPKHWGFGALKNLASIKNGKDYKAVEEVNGRYPVIGSGGQFSTANDYLYEGSSVLLGRKGTIDRPLFIEGRFWTVDTMFYTEIFKNTHPRYFYYYSLEIPFAYYSTSTALPSMTQEDLLNNPAAIPPLEEQTQIARFLDYETARIDALIEEQQRLIELLKEKRQAVISHAVTKGLDPNVPMKDSGVEWLGEVPVHWTVAGFKKYLNKIVDYRGKTPTKTEHGVFLVTARNIKAGIIDYSASQEFISEDDYESVMSRGKPRLGELLFTTEAPLGEVATIDREDIALAQRVIKLDAIATRMDNNFLKYQIMSSNFQQSLSMFATGSTALGIKAERLVYLRIVLPPICEQREIASHVERNLSLIDNLSRQSIGSIELMQERRSALISAAVTGKIDVRNWQPPADKNNKTAPQEAVHG
jgi:type I restriction enzyme S subunit